MNYIFGAGGHGKVVLDAMGKQDQPCIGFIDEKVMTEWSGRPVFQPHQIDTQAVLHLAIGNSHVREKLALQFAHHPFFSVIHPLASIAKAARMHGHGQFIAAHAVVGPDAHVANHVIVNHGAIVDHDCRVGDYCHVAPNAVLGGGVTIGQHVLIGAGAVVLPGVSIVDHVTIGAGAVVTHSIMQPGTYVGMPAKLIQR